MSADNGIYILESIETDNRYVYRVIDAQCIDNIYYDPGIDAYGISPMKHGFNRYILHDYFKHGFITHDKAIAYIKAKEIEDDLDICEYGINLITYADTFPIFTTEQMENYDSIVEHSVEVYRVKIQKSLEDRTITIPGGAIFTDGVLCGTLYGKRVDIRFSMLKIDDKQTLTGVVRDVIKEQHEAFGKV